MEPEEDNSETSTTISTLPDSILCHILSFLPTRTSMATSILSRRWRHLWKDLHVLNLDGYSFSAPELSRDQVEERFVDFVNEVLHHVQVRRIQKFRLDGEVRNYSHTLSFWIDSVTSGPHLQELYLSLWNSSGSFYTLPYSVFSCTSLVSLILKGDIIVSFDNLQSVQLPSLKNLELEVISVELDKLLSHCPALEMLKVFIFFNSGGIDPNEIHLPPSLKRLTLESEACDSTVDHLEIHTPSLEYLDLSLVACYSQISVRTYPNIVEACLNICFDDMHIDWISKLLNAICGAKLLALQASTTACLVCVPSLEFPQFCCLVRLQIGFEFFNSRVLIDLLHCCCKLEVLVIHACEV
ncbi:hypothetical protein PIB30_015651 [Stylosanthes scabra]|uniref:F-box domain-containing protein n=1 Tax=Stylosanthes scabra TaxID=79078 RepID=A0ABU6T7V7_9FABA|nr:hypothetical protein [Stylosanthes scabra]